MVKNVNWFTVIIATIAVGILLIPSFMAAWAEDEGTLGNGWFGLMFARLFDVLRFPTHVLFWPAIVDGGGALYFGTLLVNCIVYGLVIERVLSCFRRDKN